MSCGPGTIRVGDVCELDRDAGTRDAALDALPDAPPDAGPAGTAAITIGIDLAHDNVQPTDVVASPLSPAWTATFTGTVSYPLVVNGVVFVAAGGATAASPASVRALDIRTGATIWGPITTGTRLMLAYDANRVFAVDQSGFVTALDAATGAQLWTLQIPGQDFYYAPPIAAGGVLYVDGAYVLSAIDEQTSNVRWTQQPPGSQGAPTIVGGLLYLGEGCALQVFDAVNGALVWQRTIACSGGGGRTPSIYETKIWNRNGAEGSLILDHDGKALRTFAANVMPAFHNGIAFYRTNGALSAVDIATSTMRWRFAADANLCTTPLVAGAGGQVFVGSQTGKVYELDELTGSQRSVHDVGTQLTCFDEANAPSLADGHLLVPAGNELVVY